MRILNIRMGRLHVYAMTIFGLLIAGCTKEDRPESQVSETVKSFCLQWFPNERIIASERSGDGVQVTLCGGTMACLLYTSPSPRDTR